MSPTETASTQPATLAIVGIGDGVTSCADAETSAADTDCADTSNTIVIWHIELSPQLTGDRLSGAWVVESTADDAPDRLRRLVADCSVFVLDGAEVGVVKQAVEAAGSTQVDLAASVDAIRGHIGELKVQVKAEKEKPGRGKLTEPRFPRIDDFEPIEFAHVGEAAAAEVLAAARGVEKLIAQWGEIEGVRRRREYLREPWGKEARQLPLVASK